MPSDNTALKQHSTCNQDLPFNETIFPWQNQIQWINPQWTVYVVSYDVYYLKNSWFWLPRVLIKSIHSPQLFRCCPYLYQLVNRDIYCFVPYGWHKIHALYQYLWKECYCIYSYYEHNMTEKHEAFHYESIVLTFHHFKHYFIHEKTG